MSRLTQRGFSIPVESADLTGNIALKLSTSRTANLLPKPRKPYVHPTLDQTASAELSGTLFYEIHPQLWGKGIMGEAFKEIIRFAMEEVGCMDVKVGPTILSDSSRVRLI